MKYILLLILCYLSISMTAQSSNVEVNKMAAPIVKLYQLDDSQASSYKEILKKKIEAYRTASSEDSKMIDQKAILAADKEYDTAFQSILKEDQKKIFKIQNELATDNKNRLTLKANNKKIQNISTK